MSETSARLLKLLSLLQTPREWPGSELAERLAVSPRTIRRDVERLRDLGYPVEATMGAMLGCDFEVHEPPELAAYLRELGARVTRAAGDR